VPYEFVQKQTPQFSPYYPSMGQFGQSNPVTASILQMAMTSMASGSGSAMIGVNDQNLADRFDQNRLTQQFYESMRQMSELDRPKIGQYIKGMYQAVDRPYDQAGQDFANTLSGAWPTMAPIMSMINPQFADAMFGRSGSAAMFHMGAGMASRQRIDPLTRGYGLQGSRIFDMESSVWKEMYEGDKYLQQSLSSYDSGQLWNSLQSMGRAPRTSTLEDVARRRPDLISNFADVGNIADLSPDERTKLLAKPEIQAEIRGFDAKQISGTLKEWGKSIEAMREIFGDAGMPNAPVPQLIHALKQMTSGGMSQMSSSELSLMVRTFSNLAQSSGFGMEGATVMTQVNEAQATQLGLSTSFAPQVTMEGMAYGQAYSALGRGEYTGWGKKDVETLVQAKEKLQMSARASPMANQAGLSLDVEKTFGDSIKKGSRFEAYLKAIKTHQTEFGANNESTLMRDHEWTKMVKEGTNLSSGELQVMLTQTKANQEALFYNPNVLSAVEEQQRLQSGQNQIAPAARFGISGYVHGRMIGKPGEEAVTSILAKSFADTFYGGKDKFDPKWGDKKFEKERDAGIGERMMEALDDVAGDATNPNSAAAKEYIRTFGGDEAAEKAELAKYSHVSWHQGEEVADRQGLTMRALQDLYNPEVMAEARRGKSIAHAKSMLEDMFDKAGKGGLTRKFAEELLSDRSKNIPGIMMRSFGTSYESIRAAMKKANITDEEVGKFRDIHDEVEKMIIDMRDGGKTEAQRNVIEAKIEEKFGAAGEIWTKWHEGLKKAGVDLEATDAKEGTLSYSREGIDKIIKSGDASPENLKKALEPIKKNLHTFAEDPANKTRIGDKGVKELGDLESGLEKLRGGGTSAEDAKVELQRIETRLEKVMKIDDEKKDEDKKVVRVETSQLIVGGRSVGQGVFVTGGEAPVV
jgi:hypothetical protein